MTRGSATGSGCDGRARRWSSCRPSIPRLIPKSTSTAAMDLTRRRNRTAARQRLHFPDYNLSTTPDPPNPDRSLRVARRVSLLGQVHLEQGRSCQSVGPSDGVGAGEGLDLRHRHRRLPGPGEADQAAEARRRPLRFCRPRGRADVTAHRCKQRYGCAVHFLCRPALQHVGQIFGRLAGVVSPAACGGGRPHPERRWVDFTGNSVLVVAASRGRRCWRRPVQGQSRDRHGH
jgi:hypothetical protein